MYFESDEHKEFYYSCIQKDVDDCYRRSLFYLLGASDTTRYHICEIYDFTRHIILKKCLNKGWQTSGSLILVRLAFNLFNGFIDKHHPELYTPYELFCYKSLTNIMMQGIYIRFEIES